MRPPAAARAAGDGGAPAHGCRACHRAWLRERAQSLSAGEEMDSVAPRCRCPIRTRRRIDPQMRLAGALGRPMQFGAVSFCIQFRVISFHCSCSAAPQDGTLLATSSQEVAEGTGAKPAHRNSLLARECGCDRVFVQCYFGPSGPLRYGRTLRPRDQRGLSVLGLQRGLRALCAHDPTHHGPSPCRADNRAAGQPQHLRCP
jgi:hypothetical protein